MGERECAGANAASFVVGIARVRRGAPAQRVFDPNPRFVVVMQEKCSGVRRRWHGLDPRVHAYIRRRLHRWVLCGGGSRGGGASGEAERQHRGKKQLQTRMRRARRELNLTRGRRIVQGGEAAERAEQGGAAGRVCAARGEKTMSERGEDEVQSKGAFVCLYADMAGGAGGKKTENRSRRGRRAGQAAQ